MLATVRNFVEHCPGFWSSDQLLKTFTQGGDVLQLEPQYFVQVWLRWVVQGLAGPAVVLRVSGAW